LVGIIKVVIYGWGYLFHTEQEMNMAKNTGENTRKGAVKNKDQSLNPKTEKWTERNATSGKFTNVKSDGTPFKGVTKK